MRCCFHFSSFWKLYDDEWSGPLINVPSGRKWAKFRPRILLIENSASIDSRNKYCEFWKSWQTGWHRLHRWTDFPDNEARLMSLPTLLMMMPSIAIFSTERSDRQSNKWCRLPPQLWEKPFLKLWKASPQSFFFAGGYKFWNWKPELGISKHFIVIVYTAQCAVCALENQYFCKTTPSLDIWVKNLGLTEGKNYWV